ncbi:MAG: PAS domain S-box protein [Chloracidobacterium sp.]|nr:PAS domain S-box protein [Chloracidobacterium sp.]
MKKKKLPPKRQTKLKKVSKQSPAESATNDISDGRAEDQQVGNGLFTTLADNAPVLIWVTSLAGCEFDNREYLEILGLDQVEALGDKWAEFVHPEERGDYVKAFHEAVSSRDRFEAEFRFLLHDGKYRWMRSIGRPRFEGGEFMGYVGSNSDIHELKLAEATMTHMTAIIESSDDAIFSKDLNGIIVSWNKGAERLFGYAAEEVIGKSITILIPLGRADDEAYTLERIRRGERVDHYETVRRRKDGSEVDISLTVSPIRDRSGKIIGESKIARDITERKRAEEQLIEQAAMLDRSQAIVVCDLDNRVRYWSRGAKRLYGWTAEEATGRLAQELIYQEDLSKLAEATSGVVEKGKWNGELRQLTKNGRRIIVEGSWTLVRDAEGNPKNILAINTDITEKKKLESQFLRAQRLESIGTFAGGIAHDLNSVISPILTVVELLQMRLTDESSRRLLNLLHANAARGGEMVRKVLSFARGFEGEYIPLKPGRLIKEIVKIMADTMSKGIEFTFSIDPDLRSVSGDSTQLQQVLMNLCVNARDAMPEGGRLRIKAMNVEINEHYARMNVGARPGKYVSIVVTDTGFGIPEKNLAKIFDPFFTTKGHMQGTGLGLSTVAGIVRSHGGFINVYSEVGRGTRFKVYLPAIEMEPAAQAEPSQRDLLTGNGELILVIDDENAIREVARETLSAFGYRVMIARNGAEAIAFFAAHKDEVKVVMTDMMMPYMAGPATIRALHRLDPKVKIIATSGLKSDDQISDAAQLGVKIFLPKPYTAEKLLKTVAALLEED